MATEHTEIERKFDVEETFVLPDLSGVPGVASVGAPVVHDLDASYYDTVDLRLARAKITLRRRTGGTDAGWHLKLPAAAGARRELHSPLGRAVKAPPRAVLLPVLGVVRRAPAGQVATLATRRPVTPLLARTAGCSPRSPTTRSPAPRCRPPGRGRRRHHVARGRGRAGRRRRRAARRRRCRAGGLRRPRSASAAKLTGCSPSASPAAAGRRPGRGRRRGRRRPHRRPRGRTRRRTRHEADADAAGDPQDAVVDDLSEQPVPEEPLPAGEEGPDQGDRPPGRTGQGRRQGGREEGEEARGRAGQGREEGEEAGRGGGRRAGPAGRDPEGRRRRRGCAGRPARGPAAGRPHGAHRRARRRAPGARRRPPAAQHPRRLPSRARPHPHRRVRDELQWLGQELSGTATPRSRSSTCASWSPPSRSSSCSARWPPACSRPSCRAARRAPATPSPP